MKRVLFAVALLLIGLGATFALDAWDRAREQQGALDRLRTQVLAGTQRLADDLQALHALNNRLAAALARTAPGQEAASFADQAAALRRQRPDLISIVYVDQLKIALVYPTAGNENVIGLDYRLHPEFMSKIRQMLRLRRPVLDGTARLVQTGHVGLILRAPLFSPGPADADAGAVYRGMTAVTVDLEHVLLRAGLAGPDLAFDLAIQGWDDQGSGRVLYGLPENFNLPHVETAIDLSDGRWVLAAVPRADLRGDGSRRWFIRGLGGGLTLLLLLGFYLLGRQDVRPAAQGGSLAVQAKGLMPLRTLWLLAILVPLPLIASLSGWLVFSASVQGTQQMEQHRVKDLAGQLRDKVSAFFEIPRAALTFNVLQLKDGLLSLDDRPKLLHSFLLQLRQQPLLTYLSVGTAQGDYLAASRPPHDADLSLQVMQSSQADGGMMHLYRVDDANRRRTRLETPARGFDPRLRPWYTEAVQAQGLHWYQAYQYAVRAPDDRQSSLGIGMAAPLRDAAGQLVGVMAADVALSRVSQFLRREVAGLGGTALLLDASGHLLASSLAAPVYRWDDGKVHQLRADESASPLIRSLGAVMARSGRETDQQRARIRDGYHQVFWQPLPLPDGPLLTLVLSLPESRLVGAAEQSIQRVGLLILGLWVLGLSLGAVVSWWLSRPLHALVDWAGRLADGDTLARPTVRSPVREIVVLAQSLDGMAQRLLGHRQILEQQVAERTQALLQVNRQLTQLSSTDGLTGLANRRQFDQVLSSGFALSRRNQTPLSLLMIDVDWFKRYNDTYGHLEGDVVLQRLARVLRDLFRRPGDLPARYGGEEFAVILAGQARPEACRMAEKICQHMAALGMPHEHGIGGIVTVSVGVGQLAPGEDEDRAIHALINEADGALYRAKHAGRNRVDCGEPRRRR
ncbi:diguanylate cyclase [Castellaniella hirudinis]|uniref:diguanylate cyclase n=1 Tax=Castellaniella hirudinis TaxID=1144617 RepID=UPI0039C36012